ncbi:MAG: peptidase C60 family protein [Parcubacteria group bacterium Gr01-1014_56]|nr:MAG: peptidase C60 family protein [Parcubacteria group bacterium Gr01-1014_56]
MNRKERSHWLRKSAVGLGLVAIIVGGADVATRLSKNVFGDQASLLAFAPAAILIDPSLSGIAATQLSEPLVPIKLVVPALGINAAVESVGKKSDGSMASPSTFLTLAWYKLGSKPGEPGNAVFAGHVNNALTSAGVFEHLDQIKLGDTVEVIDAQKKVLKYSVEDITSYPTNAAPLEKIFATSGPSRVVLITCEGDWDGNAHSYDKRLVVVARLITP